MSDILAIIEAANREKELYGQPEIAIVDGPPESPSKISGDIQAIEEVVKRAREDKPTTNAKRYDKTLHPSYGHLDQDVYSVPDLSVRLGVHKVTVLNEIKEGRMKAKEIGGAAGYRISNQAVLDWLNADD